MSGYSLSYRPNRIEGGRSSATQMELTHDQPLRYWPERDLGYSRIEPWRLRDYHGRSEDLESELEYRFRRPTSALDQCMEDIDDGNPRASICLAKGLMNPVGSNNCFLNCAIQVLWQLNVFRKNFRELSGHACMQQSCIFCALKVIFTQFEFSNRMVLTPDALRQALANNCADQRRFQLSLMDDAAECFEIILLRLHTHLAHGITEDACQEAHCLTHQKFSMSIVEQFVCECEDTSDPLCYSQLVHYISTASLISLVRDELDSPSFTKERCSSFGQLLSRARDEGGEKSCPSNCGGRVEVRRTLTNTPEVLSVGLIWDSSKPSSAHIREVVRTISTQISPADLFYSSVEKTWAETSVFDLVGIVCYYGKHYSTFFLHPKMKTWLLYDDARVHELGSDWEAVVDKCCRSSFQPLLLLYANRVTEPLDTSTAPTSNFTIPQPQKDNQPTEHSSTYRGQGMRDASVGLSQGASHDTREAHPEKDNRYAKSRDINHNLPSHHQHPATKHSSLRSNHTTEHVSLPGSASVDSLSSSSSRSTSSSSSGMTGVGTLDCGSSRYSSSVNHDSSSAYINSRKVQDLIAAQLGNYNSRQALNANSMQDVRVNEKVMLHSTPAVARLPIDRDDSLPYTPVISSSSTAGLASSGRNSVMKPVDNNSENIVTIVPRVLNNIVAHTDRYDARSAQRSYEQPSALNADRYDIEFSSYSSAASGLSGIRSFNESSSNGSIMSELKYSSLQSPHSHQNNQSTWRHSNAATSNHTAAREPAAASVPAAARASASATARAPAAARVPAAATTRGAAAASARAPAAAAESLQQQNKYIPERSIPVQMKPSVRSTETEVHSDQFTGRVEDPISGRQNNFHIDSSVKLRVFLDEAERYLQTVQEKWKQADRRAALEQCVKCRDVLDAAMRLCPAGREIPDSVKSILTRLGDLQEIIIAQKNRQRHRSDYYQPTKLETVSTSRSNLPVSQAKILERAYDNNTPVYATYRRKKVVPSNSSTDLPLNSAGYGIQRHHALGTELERSASFDITSRHHLVPSDSSSTSAKRHGIALNEGSLDGGGSMNEYGKVISYPVDRLQISRDQVFSDERIIRHGVRFNSVDRHDYKNSGTDLCVPVNTDVYFTRRPSSSDKKVLLAGVSSDSNIGNRDRDRQYNQTSDRSVVGAGAVYTDVPRDRHVAEARQMKNVHITTRHGNNNPPSPFPGRSGLLGVERSTSNVQTGVAAGRSAGRTSSRPALPSYSQAISHRSGER